LLSKNNYCIRIIPRGKNQEINSLIFTPCFFAKKRMEILDVKYFAAVPVFDPN